MASLYILACFIFTSCTVAGQSPKYALKGQVVHLKPVITGQPDEILWIRDGNVVVEFNGSEEQKYSPYENRITLDWVTVELHITHLTYEDSGEYVLKAYVNKTLLTSTFKWEIIDKSSSAALTATLVTLVIIVLLIVVSAVAFCKLRHKACFAKEKKNDLETAPPRSPEGSDENTAQGDESSPLLGRPPTLPSTQHLVQGNRNMRPKDPASNHKEDADSDPDPEKGKGC